VSGMSKRTQALFTSAIMLEYYVYRLDAADRLRGKGARNSVHYYKSEKGFYDGIAACLDALGDRSGAPRLRERLDEASHQLRETDPRLEDPERFHTVAQALVHLVGAFTVASR
jgi:hypothetical protein